MSDFVFHELFPLAHDEHPLAQGHRSTGSAAPA